MRQDRRGTRVILARPARATVRPCRDSSDRAVKLPDSPVVRRMHGPGWRSGKGFPGKASRPTMCGIAGYVNRAGQGADRAIVERMTAVLAHRSPDSDGFYCAGPVALGHRRLSIIDVTGGAQPMTNEDGTFWVTYNGELYNELEIRPELEAKGHRYQTVSDTESLVHLYEEDGVDFVRRLNGMFALAIWDEPRQRLVLARDRMGQKPLFYSELAGGGLLFGSEPKAVLRHPEVGHGLDLDSLARYLFYEYIPAPHSIWRGL